jgi:hypothetical protein
MNAKLLSFWSLGLGVGELLASDSCRFVSQRKRRNDILDRNLEMLQTRGVVARR